MATIKRIVSPITGAVSWRAQVRIKGRSESKTDPSKKEVEDWATDTEARIRNASNFPHREAQRTTFAELVADYTKTVLPEYDDAECATRVQRLVWWSRQFDGLTLAEVTAPRISEARDVLAAETYTRGKVRKDKKTGATVQPKQLKRTGAATNRYLATLSHVLSFAVKERRLLDRNPVGDIRRKKESRGRTRFLSDAERSALLDACERSDWSALRTLVLLALTTGARRGELIGLKWDDANLKTGRALVRETKNGDERTLILAGKALEALRDLKLKNSARSAYVFPARTVTANAETGKPDLDAPFEWFDKEWHAALDVAGIENFRFHDLRHSTASMLAAQGASLLEIADVLGHRTLNMVRRYSHLVVDHKASVIEKLVAAKGL